MSLSRESYDVEDNVYYCTANGKNFVTYYSYVINNSLYRYDAESKETLMDQINLIECTVNSLDQKFKRKYPLELTYHETLDTKSKLYLCFEDKLKRDFWHSILQRNALPNTLPEYIYFADRKEERSLIIPIVSLKECTPKSKHSILWRRLRICGLIFDPKNITYKKEIIYKIKILKELNEVLNEIPTLLNDRRSVYDIVNVLKHNIIRPLPFCDKVYASDKEEEEYLFKDPNMQTLSYSYEVLISLINSPGIDLIYKQEVFDVFFCKQIIDLFQSNDPSEREYLKRVLHCLYAKLLCQRILLRKYMNNSLCESLYSSTFLPGMNELLYIYTFIIEGMNVPIREEHMHTFRNVILPLHKYKYIETIYMNLSKCVYLYISKNPYLINDSIQGLCHWWPYGNRLKEQLFVDEIEHMLLYVHDEHITSCKQIFLKRIQKSLSCDQYEVLLKQLHYWKVNSVLCLLLHNQENSKILFPMICPSLCRLYKTHWWPDVQKCSKHVLELYSKEDSIYKTMIENELQKYI